MDEIIFCPEFTRHKECPRGRGCRYKHDWFVRNTVCAPSLDGKCKLPLGDCPKRHDIDNVLVGEPCIYCPQFTTHKRCKYTQDTCWFKHDPEIRKMLCEDHCRGQCSKGKRCTKSHEVEKVLKGIFF